MEAFRQPPDEDISSAGFPEVPASWYYVGSLAEMAARPLSFQLPGTHRYVAFRPPGGAPAVLSARCGHMNADLAHGCVKNGRLACPLHGWEYGTDGKCEVIPASPQIPAFARQMSYPVAERGGHVFFYNRPQAPFPLPFFRGVEAHDLRPARPFELITDTPWYLISGNGFDMQHFRCSHDRTLVGEVAVDAPHPFAWRVRANFEVTGRAFTDRLTKWFYGSVVEMTIENWGGALLLVTAKFRRTSTYGLVSLVPLENHQTRVRDIVWVQRSRNPLARWLLDPLNAAIRRIFIREFLRSDVTSSAGIRFHPGRMIPEDKVMVEFLEWLHKLHQPTQLPAP